MRQKLQKVKDLEKCICSKILYYYYRTNSVSDLLNIQISIFSITIYITSVDMPQNNNPQNWCSVWLISIVNSILSVNFFNQMESNYQKKIQEMKISLTPVSSLDQNVFWVPASTCSRNHPPFHRFLVPTLLLQDSVMTQT